MRRAVCGWPEPRGPLPPPPGGFATNAAAGAQTLPSPHGAQRERNRTRFFYRAEKNMESLYLPLFLHGPPILGHLGSLCLNSPLNKAHSTATWTQSFSWHTGLAFAKSLNRGCRDPAVKGQSELLADASEPSVQGQKTGHGPPVGPSRSR